MGRSQGKERRGFTKSFLIFCAWLVAFHVSCSDQHDISGCSVTNASVNTKILKCNGVTAASINSDFSSGDVDVIYQEIILENVHFSADDNLNVINEHQTESLKLINSRIDDKQLQKIFHGKNFQSFRSLDVSGNQLETLNRDTFHQIMRLRYLSLASNKIKEISSDVFSDLLDLSELSLAGNKLVNFNNGIEVFKQLRQLKILDLSNNSINNIERHVFYGLENLVDLNMSRNKLYILPYQVFESMRAIEVVDLSHNILVSFLDNFFIHNHRLKTLQLHNNLIGKINKNSLYGLRELHTLDLSYNQLLTVDRNAFDTLDGLKFLNLHHNSIHLLSANVFLSLKQLQSLDLSDNVLELLPLGIFAHQFELRELIMENTRITRLSNWISKTNTNATIDKNVLKNLRVISLNNSTSLHTMESSFLHNMPSAEKLTITRSQITFLPMGIDEMPRLVDLDLSSNRLEFIPQGIKHLTELKSLNLLNNDLQCDCHMFWMLNWIDELKMKNKSLPSELLRLSELKCRNGYPGDIIRVLQHINCVKPHLIFATKEQTYELFTDAILECSFAGTPAPQIVWRTPYGEILRLDEGEIDKTAKFQLEQLHNSVLKNTEANVKYQEIIDMAMKSDQSGERVRQGPGLTLLENGYLKVHNISRLDGGLYSCYAVNIMGNATTEVR